MRSQNNNQASKIITDLRLFKNLRSAKISDQESYHPTNLKQLGNIIKNRNNQFKKYDGSRDLSLVWMKSMNVNLDRINQQLYHQKKARQNIIHYQRQSSFQQPSTKVHFDPQITKKQFPFDKLTLQNQSDFLTSQHQFIIHNIVKNSIKKSSNYKKVKEAQTKWQNTNQYYDDQLQSKIYNRSQRQKIKIQQLKNQTQYFKIIQNAVENNKYDNLNSQFLRINIGKKHQKYWAILNQQMQCCNQQQSSDLKSLIYRTMYNSLKKLEHQNWNNLSSDLKRLDKTKGHIGWGVTYTFYKAGNKTQFYKHFKNKNMKKLLNSFIQYDKEVENGEILNKQIWFQEQNQIVEPDQYLAQLIYILKGQKKISNEILCNPYQADFAWIILRLYGLYLNRGNSLEILNNLKQYRAFLNEIKKSYQRNNQKISECVISNLFYLSDYPTLVSLTEKYKITQEKNFISSSFYLHLLIVLYYSPHPLLQFSVYQDFQQKILPQVLAQKLLIYITNLINKNLSNNNKANQQTPNYYLMMIPMDKWVQTVPKIFSNIEMFKQIYWKFVGQKMRQINSLQVNGQQIFKKTMQITLYKLCSQTRKQTDIQKIVQLFQLVRQNDKIQKLQIFTSLFIRKTLQKNKESNSLCNQYDSDNQKSFTINYYNLKDYIERIFYELKYQTDQIIYQCSILFQFCKIFHEINSYYLKGMKKQAHQCIYLKCNNYLTNQNGLSDDFLDLIKGAYRLNKKVKFSMTQQSQNDTIKIIFQFLSIVNRIEQMYYYEQGGSKMNKKNVKQRIQDIAELIEWQLQNLKDIL